MVEDAERRLQQIEQRLTHLEDVEGIKRLIGRFARAADNQLDPEMTAPLFSDDAHWDTGALSEQYGEFKGRDALLQGLADMAKQNFPWAMHYMTTPIVDVAEDGETARASYYLWCLLKVIPEEGGPEGAGEAKSTWVCGWYDTRFKKQNGAWRIQNSSFTHNLWSGADKPDWDTRPAGPPST